MRDWVKDIPYDDFCKMVEERQSFSFSRYGDGEWVCLGKLKDSDRRNCDGHYFYEDLGDRLQAILKSRPKYLLGMQNLALQAYGTKYIDIFLAEHKLTDLNWVQSDTLHRASTKHNLARFAQACKKAVWIGPAHLMELAKRLEARAFVETSRWNFWATYKQAEKQALDIVQDGDLILLSCGMPAKVLLDVLHNCGRKVTIIDTGSVWDPYCGVRSRKYMRGGDFLMDELFRGTDA